MSEEMSIGSRSINGDDAKKGKYTPKSKRGTPAPVEKSKSKSKNNGKNCSAYCPAQSHTCSIFFCNDEHTEDEFDHLDVHGSKSNACCSCCGGKNAGKGGGKGGGGLMFSEQKKASFGKGVPGTSKTTAKSTEKYPGYSGDSEVEDETDGDAANNPRRSKYHTGKLEEQLRELHSEIMKLKDTVKSQEDEIKVLTSHRKGKKIEWI
jgi:hypothetical protein